MILLTVAVLLAFASAPPAANATTERVPVSSHLVDALVFDGRVVERGSQYSGTFQFRDASAQHWWEGDAYLQGTAFVTYDLVSGWACTEAGCNVTGRLWGTVTMYPDAFDGTWQGTFTFYITSYSYETENFSYEGKVVAEGFGELEGLELRLDAAADGTFSFPAITQTGYVLIPGP